jgi:hypothetical protein
VNDVSNEFNIKTVVQLGHESTPGIVTNYLQALVLDDLEFKVV